jgi:adenylate cyclase
LELGLKLNPKEPRRDFALTWLAGAFLNARKYAEALDHLNVVLSRQADYPLTHLFRATCQFYLGSDLEAKRSLQECEKVKSGFASEFIRWRAYRLNSDNEHMIKPLLKLGVEA